MTSSDARQVTAIDVSKDPISRVWASLEQPSAFSGVVGAGLLSDPMTLSIFRGHGGSGQGPLLRLDLSGAVKVASQDLGLPKLPDYDRNAAVFISRAGSSPLKDLVMVGTRGAGLSRVQRLSGETLTPVWTVYAADGLSSVTPPAKGYALHAPIVFDIDGDGIEDVVFGGDDGRVYALRATDGSLTMSMQVGAPTQDLIAANIDDDQPLELVATLLDGRVVAIDDVAKYNSAADAGPEAGDAQPDATVDSAGSDAADSAGAPAGAGGAVEGSGCSCRAEGAGTERPPYGLGTGFWALLATWLLRSRQTRRPW